MNRLQKQLDMIKTREETKTRTLHAVLQHKRKRHLIPQMTMAVMVGCLLLFLIRPWNTSSPSSSKAVSYVTLDINPSMEFTLNEENRILDIKAYNEDAKKILSLVDIKGMEIQNAWNQLWALDQWNSYIEKGILEVGIYSSDDAIAISLEKELNTYLQSTLSDGHYHCSHIDDTVFEEAKEHHTSMGKYRVIQEILSYTDRYTIDELSDKSMRALYDILATFDASAVPKECMKQKEDGQNKHHHQE